ncbi:hypothetical protein ES319_D12G272200v1 [Gossypium barbadense]|uniref:F-box domain-containing protein n=1 Tax=Gossypium barbadense TaxID=3634 RepID=A0A5J5P370_GOSBA|nr:hypothetical protein ES319_D12G272200v1 [Gossypium barbadense]
MGKWVDLNPDILSLILLRIPTHQRVSTASLVCKSPLSCVLDPFFWSDIDLLDWYRRHPYLEIKYVDSTVRKLIRRSKGTFRRLFSFRLGDAGFASLLTGTAIYHSGSGRCLQVLEIPMSEVNDKTLVKFAESLANLTVSKVSYCSKITHVGIEAFGKNCKSWTQLKRNMPPRALERLLNTSTVNELKAMAIVDIMPFVVGAIRANCKALTHLEIHGCLNVKLETELEDSCRQLFAFRRPPSFHWQG